MRAVLFDLDGVLVKSEEAWFFAVEESGRRFRGAPITREEFFPTFGQGTAADIISFGLKCSAQELDKFYVEQFQRHLSRVWVNPDAKPILEFLEAEKLPCALVTNSVAPIAEMLLNYSKLRQFFKVLASADRVKNAKPAPDLVFLALQELQVAPNDALMVGDSRFDRMAAGSAGVHFAGLLMEGEARIESLLDLRGRLDFQR